MRKLLLFVFSAFAPLLFAQDMKALYQRADSFGQRYTNKYYYGVNEIAPVGGTSSFWYSTRTPRGTEFFLINPEKKTLLPAFNHERLAEAIAAETGQPTDAWKLPFRRITLGKEGDSIRFNINDEDYAASLTDYKVVKKRYNNSGNRYWGAVHTEKGTGKTPSPDGKKEAFIREGNLWITNLETKDSQQLSYDGSTYEYYSSNIHWSPDSRMIACCKYSPVETRKLLMISSSPKHQLQPVTEEYDYVKPGDPLPIRRPVLFMVDEQKAIPVEFPEMDKQFSLSNIRWDKNSRFFTFDFNKRGHQRYTIYAVDAPGGTLRTVINEESPTFIYYSRLEQRWLDESDEVLWISERDGWRHIYLYDALTGKVKKQLTKGEWVVKSIVHLDEKNNTLLFKACGMDAGEDPYLEKYYALNMNNGKITPLTPEDANHSVVLSADNRYMADCYSRVDAAPTFVIRSAKTGKIVYKPEQQPDISRVLEAGWRMPEVFSAKGRDGETDIWGIIMRPPDYDPAKKYPVVEYIYAGPHDSHVPKSFSVWHWSIELTELGFITVIIDGMGTANRSKAFHDVCWKNLKDAGFPDRIAWLRAAAARYPEMDIERMGIYGCSAGGQSAMGALLFHPEFYKVGVSACGCHDNRMDKIWWNEQWMGYPIGKEYEECSNTVNAHKLQGKLMLILGELDNNVDPSSTLQVVNELIKHDKEFEFVMLPGERHTMGGKYGERKRRDFLVRHLMGIP